MDLSQVNFLAVAALAAIVGVTLVVVHLSLRRLRRELTLLRHELNLCKRMLSLRPSQGIPASAIAEESPAPSSPTPSAESPEPEDILDEQQLRERLNRGGNGPAPERYRMAAKLAGKGLAAEELSEVLQVSTDEARQLVSLAQVASAGKKARQS